jgi:hypothetical protein
MNGSPYGKVGTCYTRPPVLLRAHTQTLLTNIASDMWTPLVLKIHQACKQISHEFV